MRSASTQHLHREPCSEQQAPCLACPTLPPQVGLRKPPTVGQIRVPIMLCGRRRRCTSTGSPAQNNRLSFWPVLPSPHRWALENLPLSVKFGCPSCCAVDGDAAPPQGALLKTTGLVFGLSYPPFSRALGNPPLSIRIGWPIMLSGRRRRCASTVKR